MDGMKEWAFPTTRVGDAVKFRPASLETISRRGCDPWSEGDTTLEELCARSGGKAQDLAEELMRLPVAPRDSAWEKLPADRLIDFLTVEHRELLHDDLPALRSILEMPFGQAAGSGLYRILLESFHRFSDLLREHILEEEDHLFPAILKNAYALRQGGPQDGIRPIAGKLAAASALTRNEEELDAALGQWARLAGKEGVLGNRPETAGLAMRAMAEFERKLRAHGKLEREVLFRIAARLEDQPAAAAAG